MYRDLESHLNLLQNGSKSDLKKEVEILRKSIEELEDEVADQADLLRMYESNWGKGVVNIPYIKQIDRLKYDDAIDNVVNALTSVVGHLPAGDLNYVFTSIMHRIVGKTGLSYSTLNALIGVLVCVKDEFYRKVVVPYENEKEKIHGGVCKLCNKKYETILLTREKNT